MTATRTHGAPLHAHPRRHADPTSGGTVAVVIFVFGAIVLVLAIILALLFFKKRRSSAKNRKSFIPRLERQQQRGGNYGKLEEDEEGAWSADMGEAGMGMGRGKDGGREGYAPVSGS
ncbi:hypothetical protein G6514_003680 [Epicoccum nigrum]|nr:hypothetical protein G6514_003680 [Epicoccum nigrum]